MGTIKKSGQSEFILPERLPENGFKDTNKNKSGHFIKNLCHNQKGQVTNKKGRGHS